MGMSTNNNIDTEEFQGGYRAYRNHQKRDANPYPLKTREHVLWDFGWEEAWLDDK